jgi:hypothetical protein
MDPLVLVGLVAGPLVALIVPLFAWVAGSGAIERMGR